MKADIKLGRIWGIPIGLDFRWFINFGLVTWSLAAGLLSRDSIFNTLRLRSELGA
jgi:hypothetical protein